jgi:hypothetical protein
MYGTVAYIALGRGIILGVILFLTNRWIQAIIEKTFWVIVFP